MSYYADYEHYRDAWDNARCIDPHIPLNVDVELSTVCNLQCPFCFTTSKKFKEIKTRPFMDKDLVYFIISEVDKLGIPAIKFNWRGESTLHQDFTEILKKTKKQYSFYDIIVNTNGNVPDHALEGLRYTTKVVISLDAFGKDLYSSLRKKGDIRNVINTINYLIESGHENIWVRRIINKKNENEMFVDIAKNIFSNKVKVSEHYCFDRNENESFQIKDFAKNRKYCCYPSQRLVISTDGYIYPCCVDYFQTMPLGHILYDNLLTVWQSYNLSKLRINLRYNNHELLPQQCQNCTSFMAYNTPERDFVQDKNINET